MKYYSTNNKNNIVSFKTAVLEGLAADGGLYMPLIIPKMENEYFSKNKNHSFKNTAFPILKKYIEDEIPENDFIDIVDNIFTFNSPLVLLDNNTMVLELFNGPTLAFKDFGAQFTAAVTEYFNKNEKRKLIILVATSGDTGSAVANGFYNKNGIEVVVLYPKNKISFLQEKQITTLGGNVKALEIEGTFDDCQRLVKTAFNDKFLKNNIRLSSANSINIARLLPQMIYYYDAYFNCSESAENIVFTVPSGNLGNLTAGLITKKMGLPVNKFIAALNINDVFNKYLKTSVFKSEKSVKTYANAMDVGNPSNLARIIDLYNNEHKKIMDDVVSNKINDDEILNGIKEVYTKYGYIIDPHGAVGYAATKKMQDKFSKNTQFIILETAHPAKFYEIIENALNKKIEKPDRLTKCIDREKKSSVLSSNYEDLKEYLLSINE
ncbi:MAG TPA: threonine synthase [Melioribacteraceae bacterium]|nr:threonine synthase [Melioribacteraceae bacterium]